MDLLADDVTARYQKGTAVLADLSLNVTSGETVALIGPSGSGKTTLFRLLTRTIRPDKGRVVIGGHDIGRLVGRDLRTTRASIGVIHQRGDLVPTLTALANVAIASDAISGPLAALRLATTGPCRTLAARSRDALDRLEVGHLGHVRVNDLSGGERQRVAVARLLLQRPRLVLADEPTASVDERSASLVIDALLDLARNGTTLLLATHDLAVARRLDRVIALANGEISHDGRMSLLDAHSRRRIYANETPARAETPTQTRPPCR